MFPKSSKEQKVKYGTPKTIECQECKKEFSIPNWRLGKAKYCSYNCSIKARTTSKSYNALRKCVNCQKEYLPTGWSQKYCTRECFCKGIKKTQIKKCINCQKEFQQVRIGQKYCSRGCSSPYKDMSLKKPKNVSLDNLWSKAVKAKAGDKCEYCGKKEGLNSHHIFSRSNRRTRWDIDNGVCICVLHHVFGNFSAHKSPIEFAEWLKEYRGIDWYERLRAKAKITSPYKKPNKEEEALIRESLKF